MNNNEIDKKESAYDLAGRLFTKEFFEELEKHNKAILSAISSSNKDIEKIAFNLYWIYQNKAYKAMGHDSIMDYAREFFEIEKSTTYNYINVVERFGARDKDGILTLKGFCKSYKDYSYSKLLLLSSIPEDDINYIDVNPDMSVRDIKKVIKNNISSGFIGSLTPSSKSIIYDTDDMNNFDSKPDLHQPSNNKDDELSFSNIQVPDNEDNEINEIESFEKYISFSKFCFHDDIRNFSKIIEDIFKVYPDCLVKVNCSFTVIE